jgi:hypothetical protein
LSKSASLFGCFFIIIFGQVNDWLLEEEEPYREPSKSKKDKKGKAVKNIDIEELLASHNGNSSSS